MLILKGIAGILSSPLLIGLMVACLGLPAMRAGRRRMGHWFLASGAALAYLASTSLVGNAMIAPLENQYPVFEPTRAIGARAIVVLGSGYDPRRGIPVTGALDADGLARIVEGVRLARLYPDARLLVSGGAPAGFARPALGYAQMATELGIAPSRLVIMDRALNTAQESRDVVASLGNAPFILVTSAYHMPRAMLLMQHAGGKPIPAPTGQMSSVRRAAEQFGVVPWSRALRKTETALHEYWGLAAAGLHID